jgi:thiol-disulfide isomerase/thioredoxin
MIRNIAVVALLIAAAAAGYITYINLDDSALPVAEEAVVSMPSGSSIVDFTLADLDGNERQISEWAGKARLINFWATWCAPCRREIPLLKKTQSEQAQNNLQIIGVAVDFVEPVIAYAADADFNYPVLVGQEDAMAAAEATGIDFIGMPFTLIVAPDGQLIATHMGEILEDQMALIIEVFEQMQHGETDLASARSALKSL